MCMKGLFTRSRQTKMAAFVTRARYLDLADADRACRDVDSDVNSSERSTALGTGGCRSDVGGEGSRVAALGQLLGKGAQ